MEYINESTSISEQLKGIDYGINKYRKEKVLLKYLNNLSDIALIEDAKDSLPRYDGELVDTMFFIANKHKYIRIATIYANIKALVKRSVDDSGEIIYDQPSTEQVLAILKSAR